MSNRIEHITVVGGGTAGWMSALMLVSFLNRSTHNPIKITLIESANIPTVGVGEATVPGMVGLMKSLGIDEFEFFNRCNASFKCGVRFVDWNKKPDGSSQTFVHPFQTAPYIDHFRSAYHFHRFAGAEDDFAGSVIANQEMVDAGKGPRPLSAKQYDTTFNYAYHLDAGLFANFMRDLAIERGVEHIYDDIEDVNLDENGRVASLQLKEGGTRPVEFVIDCTGFRGLIINQALKEPFTSFNDMLLCDRALALQVDHVCEDEIESCTTSTALGAGWVWNVPLYNRVGTGYVFSSKFRSDDEAMAEFLAHLGPRAGGKEPRVVPMRVGRSDRCWVGNCLAVGLASGFIEPLESTAIYIVEMQMRWFLESFPDKSVNPLLAKRYNRWMDDLYEEIVSFIVLHYRTSNRDDTEFWRTVRNETPIPDSLAENLETWRYSLPGPVDTQNNKLFNYWNYLYVLFGKRYYDDVEYSLETFVPEQQWRLYSERIDTIKRNIRERLPTHKQLLDQIRGQATGRLTLPDSGAMNVSQRALAEPTLAAGESRAQQRPRPQQAQGGR